MIMRIVVCLFFSFVLLPYPTHVEGTGVIQTNEVIVLFEEPLESAAEEVADIFPEVKAELKATFRWGLTARPAVLLIKNRKKFENMTGHNRIVAFAVPEKNLIVIDYSRMNRRPFTLGVTLKHELCHLLLHHHIGSDNLPKWLGEGICQWVSDGIAEIIMDRNRSVLREATLSGNYIPMDALAEGFPQEEDMLLLAYEQSKSFVEYIHSQFGWQPILDVLQHLKEGDEAGVAILRGLSVPLEEIEMRWHGYLRRKTTWFTYLVRHLYVILFFVAALITIYGFIRVLIKKRRYTDGEDDGFLPGGGGRAGSREGI